MSTNEKTKTNDNAETGQPAQTGAPSTETVQQGQTGAPSTETVQQGQTGAPSTETVQQGQEPEKNGEIKREDVLARLKELYPITKETKELELHPFTESDVVRIKQGKAITLEELVEENALENTDNEQKKEIIEEINNITKSKNLEAVLENLLNETKKPIESETSSNTDDYANLLIMLYSNTRVSIINKLLMLLPLEISEDIIFHINYVDKMTQIDEQGNKLPEGEKIQIGNSHMCFLNIRSKIWEFHLKRSDLHQLNDKKFSERYNFVANALADILLMDSYEMQTTTPRTITDDFKRYKSEYRSGGNFITSLFRGSLLSDYPYQITSFIVIWLVGSVFVYFYRKNKKTKKQKNEIESI